MIDYDDIFLNNLEENILGMLAGEDTNFDQLISKLDELAMSNHMPTHNYRYKSSLKFGIGIPDTAFKNDSIYFFPNVKPEITFQTSGTSGNGKGVAHYSPRGKRLLDAAIVANAKNNLICGLDKPAILRFVPTPEDAPGMVMAYGMDLISKVFGHPDLSCSLVSQTGIDTNRMEKLLNQCCRDNIPVILIGGSFALVNLCDQLIASNCSWMLPAKSRAIDAGGFKSRSRELNIDSMKQLIEQIFSIPSERCINLFGMTELASQLPDIADISFGPNGERPKNGNPFCSISTKVRDPFTLEIMDCGKGLLEVTDLCIIDRPYCILTGDFGYTQDQQVAITGRVIRGQTRGCSLVLEELTKRKSKEMA